MLQLYDGTTMIVTNIKKPVMQKPCFFVCEDGGGEKTTYLSACVGNTAQQHKYDAFFYAQPYRHINMYVWLRYIHSPCSHQKASNLPKTAASYLAFVQPKKRAQLPLQHYDSTTMQSASAVESMLPHPRKKRCYLSSHHPIPFDVVCARW